MPSIWKVFIWEFEIWYWLVFNTLFVLKSIFYRSNHKFETWFIIVEKGWANIITFNGNLSNLTSIWKVFIWEFEIWYWLVFNPLFVLKSIFYRSNHKFETWFIIVEKGCANIITFNWNLSNLPSIWKVFIWEFEIWYWLVFNPTFCTQVNIWSFKS